MIAVLIVMTIAILMATGLLFASTAEYNGSTVSLNAVQSRSLAWSGVQVVRSLLNDSRQDILEGDLPRLDEQYEIYEAGGELGIVRLLPVTPGGERLSPEAGRLDVNIVDARMLADTGMVDIVLARAIASGRPYQSVADLLRVDGITPDLLYGPIEDLTVMDDASLEEGTFGERLTEFLSGAEPRGLADVITVYGYEPNIQRSERLRINLNVPWSDELGDRVAERYDRGTSEILQELFESGITFEEEKRLYQVLRQFDVEPDEWPDIVDVFTTLPDEYVRGRVDINTAPYEVLASLPGIEPEQADRLIQVRDMISREARATVAWPAIEEILTPEQYDDLAPWLTTRSWNYRVRIAAGTVPVDDPEAPLDDPVIYEVVLDLSAPTARVAYLRDISLLQTTVLLAANATYGVDDAADESRDAPDDESEFEDLDADLPEDEGSIDGGSENSNRMSFGGGGNDADDASTSDENVNETSGNPVNEESGAAGSTSQSGKGRPRVGRWRRTD